MTNMSLRRLMGSLFPCLLPAALAVASVEAGTINVSPGESIQTAIDAASAGDEVVVAAGPYLERIDFKGKAITVRSADPGDPAVVAATVIDGDGAGAVATFASGEGSDSVLAGLTLANGTGAAVGGGVQAGGGIYCTGSSPTISGNVIAGNSALMGAGIYCTNASPIISGNTIRGNSAMLGGGICCVNASSPTITNSAISGNTGSTYGGAILCLGGSNATVRNTSMSGNSAAGGGGIYCSQASPVIVDSIIAFSPSGGGVYIDFIGSVSLRYCNVYGNAGGNFLGLADPTGANGNISIDPFFADAAAGDLHLRSCLGRWDPAAASWVVDAQQSPCIDAGDPGSAYGSEPFPHGYRANMGAYGNTQQASNSPDQPPAAPALVEVTPATPTTLDDLTASASGATDPDGDPLTYEYEWSKTTDGGASWGGWAGREERAATPTGGSGGNVLDHRLTAKGEQWKARARAYDGARYGPWAESGTAMIDDTPPTAPTVVTVDPGSPRTDDDLAASASGSTDADGEAVSYEYEWSHSAGGGPWGEWGYPGPTLVCGETAKGQQWKARARATADGQTSDWTESGPVAIENSAPTLAWTGEPGFRRDGHSPESGRPNSTPFRLRAKVTDLDGTAPRRMFVRVQRLEDGRRWRTVRTPPLQPVSGTWAGGMTCRATTTLPNGVHRYRVYARDDGAAVATGEPRRWRRGPRIIAAPQLWCTGLAGRQTDFLEPEAGTARETRFRFAVQYTDGEGGPPQLHRLELQKRRVDGRWGHFTTVSLRVLSGTALSGRYYSCVRRLRAGDYRHRFVFEDDNGAATGTASQGANATRWQAGPTVTEATADATAGIGGATLTGLAAMPSNAGAQIVFSLSAPMTVDARVLNISGRPVRTLCRSQDCEAGTNTLLWNAQSDNGLSVPNGTYLVEVMASTPDGTQARGLTQLRISR